MRAWLLPGRWPDEDLFEGYGHDGPGVCLGDGQTEAYLRDMGMTGLASACAMARRRPKEYRREILGWSPQDYYLSKLVLTQTDVYNLLLYSVKVIGDGSTAH